MRIAAATVIVSVATLMARAQAPRQIPATSVQPIAITGRVVADDTGRPVPNARVSLTPVAVGTPVVLTDRDGRFAFTAAPGRYTLVASKSGYARETTPTTGQPMDVRLRRGAALSGRVIDEFGDPVPAVRVVAETVSGATTATIDATQTDDRGEYRLAPLRAGTFAVAVVRVNSMMTTAAPGVQKTYYPGVATPSEAEGLRVQFGEERAQIDFVLPANQAPNQPFTVAMNTGTIIMPFVAPIVPRPGERATGIIRGRVVSTDGRALTHAQVRLSIQTGPNQSALVRADATGHFEFSALPAGTFYLIAGKAGYVPVAPGQPQGGSSALNIGRSVTLADGEIQDRVDVSLARWGTLTGRVVDELGDPLQGASVQVLQVRYETGRRRLVAAAGAMGLTDDLGRYRLYNLPAGQYVVSATAGAVASADVPGYARAYFPGTPDASAAQFVSVAPAQDVVGIDFSLSRTRTARITGKLLNAAGEPTMGGSVNLMPSQHSASVTSLSIGARILPDGTFEFPNIPPGQYVMQADRGRTNAWTEGEFGTMPVAVNGTDVTGLTLQTSSGSAITGGVTFDTYNQSKLPSPSTLELSPVPVDFDLTPQRFASANIHTDWSFEIVGINGPRRLQLLRTPVGWALKEIRVNGIDVTDRALPFGRRDQSLAGVEVVLTDRVSELNGTITDDGGRPVGGASVVLFSTDRDRWSPASRFLRTTVAGPDGTFTVAGLPFGTYYAAAVGQLPVDGEDAWQDPAFLVSLVPRTSTVTIREGQNQVLSLRLATR